MHGLGADGHDFEPLVPELQLPDAPSIRWIFPHAPVRSVSINGGESMRAWYDIIAIDPLAPEDGDGIRASAAAIGVLVRTERERGIAAHRIVLAGFSQGGAMALFTALRWHERLGGVIALSCYMPLPSTIPTEAHPVNAAIPLFMAHGTLDPVVPLHVGEGSKDLLRSNGYDVAWRTYSMQHSMCAEEVGDLRAWLLRVLPITR
jgi:phospholipase/carboxylesterase